MILKDYKICWLYDEFKLIHLLKKNFFYNRIFKKDIQNLVDIFQQGCQTLGKLVPCILQKKRL